MISILRAAEVRGWGRGRTQKAYFLLCSVNSSPFSVESWTKSEKCCEPQRAWPSSTVLLLIVIKNTRKILRAIFHSLWFFFFVRKWHNWKKYHLWRHVTRAWLLKTYLKRQLARLRPGWVVGEFLMYKWEGLWESFMWWPPILNTELTLKKFPFLNCITLCGWTAVLYSRTPNCLQTWKPFLSRKWFNENYPSQLRCLCRLTPLYSFVRG